MIEIITLCIATYAYIFTFESSKVTHITSSTVNKTLHYQTFKKSFHVFGTLHIPKIYESLLSDLFSWAATLSLKKNWNKKINFFIWDGSFQAYPTDTHKISSDNSFLCLSKDLGTLNSD